MTGRERIAVAMNRGVPDRVPVMCQFSIGHMLLQLGVSPVEFWCDAAVYVDGLFRMRAMYDFDGILVSLHGHDPGWRDRVASRRETAEGEEVLWIDGTRTVFPRDDLPRNVSDTGSQPPPVHERMPGKGSAPMNYIPVSQGLRFAIHPDHRFDVLEQVVRLSEGRFSVHGEVTSPFDYVLDRYGHQRALLALVDDPNAVKKALEAVAEGIAGLAVGMCATGLDAIKISSPYAGAGFISPAFYAEFVLPYEQTVVAAIQQTGVRAYLHTCGAIRDRLPLMIRSGAAGIECLDPPPLGNIELAEALSVIGGLCFVKGNVDPVNTLLRGTPAGIAADVRARLDIAASKGGFILSTACSIAPRVPRSHVSMLRDAVEHY